MSSANEKIINATLYNPILINATLKHSKLLNDQEVNGPSVWPLKYLKNWSPFRIDALGLVTLLGADEINANIGTLIRSWVFEYMPLLGAFVISSDAFTERQSGFLLHNVTEFTVTPELAGWFTRWMNSQNFHAACSKVTWRIVPDESTLPEVKPEKYRPLPNSFPAFHGFPARYLGKTNWIALLVGIIVNLGFISFTALMYDWWGFANAVSMAFSVVVRWYCVSQNRRWLDESVRRADAGDTSYRIKKGGKPGEYKSPKRVKLIVITPDVKAVFMDAPDSVVRNCFVRSPAPFLDNLRGIERDRQQQPAEQQQSTELRPKPTPQADLIDTDRPDKWARTRYDMIRWLGWLAFGAHVITIGMSDLVTQLVTVVIIVGPTIMMVLPLMRRWHCEERWTQVDEHTDAVVQGNALFDPQTGYAVCGKTGDYVDVNEDPDNQVGNTPEHYGYYHDSKQRYDRKTGMKIDPLDVSLLLPSGDASGTERIDRQSQKPVTMARDKIIIKNKDGNIEGYEDRPPFNPMPLRIKTDMLEPLKSVRESKIGTKLIAYIEDWKDKADEERRVDLYASLGLSNQEEECLKKWNLTPDVSNKKFWNAYERKKAWYGLSIHQRKSDLKERNGTVIAPPSRRWLWSRIRANPSKA